MLFKTCHAAIEPWLGEDDPRRLDRLFDENGHYMWGESDLPERMSQLGKDYAYLQTAPPSTRSTVFGQKDWWRFYRTRSKSSLRWLVDGRAFG